MRISTSRNKVRSVRGFLDEYACYTGALISLYEVTAVLAYPERAEQVGREVSEQFADVKSRGYFLFGFCGFDLRLKMQRLNCHICRKNCAL